MEKPRKSRIAPATLVVAMAVVLGLALASFGEVGDDDAPYREKLPDGTVDWYDGVIQANGSAPVLAGQPPAKAKLDAGRVALMKAQAAALRIAMRVPVDSERRLESYEALKVKVRGVVSGGRVISEEQKGKEVFVTLEVPLSGVKGLQAEVLPVYFPEEEKAQAPPPKKPAADGQKGQVGAQDKEPAAAAPAVEAPVSSVVLEASQAGAKPAIFPRIIDTEGNEVYSVKTVGRLNASQRPMARYTGKSVGPAHGWGTGLDGDYSLPLGMLTVGAPVWLAQAQQPARKRGGGDALVIRAESAKGSLKADIVVTKEDARRLREAEEKSKVLSESKVVVVLRSDVGGVEGRLVRPGRSGAGELAISIGVR